MDLRTQFQTDRKQAFEALYEHSFPVIARMIKKMDSYLSQNTITAMQADDLQLQSMDYPKSTNRTSAHYFNLGQFLRPITTLVINLQSFWYHI